jgi:hypothetical protein
MALHTDNRGHIAKNKDTFKTVHHNIAEILLKVALKTIK